MKKCISNEKVRQRGITTYHVFRFLSLFTVLFLLSTQPIYANNIWDKANVMFKDVYDNIVKISTGGMVVVVAIATFLTMFSKNGRTVDEARSWRMRAIIAWAIINGLGFVTAYLIPLFQGVQWNG